VIKGWHGWAGTCTGVAVIAVAALPVAGRSLKAGAASVRPGT
jgi:hypothetical protein